MFHTFSSVNIRQVWRYRDFFPALTHSTDEGLKFDKLVNVLLTYLKQEQILRTPFSQKLNELDAARARPAAEDLLKSADK